MWRKLVLVAVCLSFPAAALAHLCNDVFVQAKDNLAVKVDVRDGQLRIGKTASFRVYLLNTMDREIAKIALEVRTNNKFTAKVTPSPAWKDYPKLYSANPKARGKTGKKEYFQVTLTRKPGVPDGRYKIDLHIYNPRKKSMVFKTVNLGSAAGICEVPKATKVTVDGKASSTEWGKSFLATGFYSYVKKRKWFVNVPAADQSLFRVTADKDNLYLYLGFQGGAGATSDVADFYLAPNVDATPVKFSVDRLTGKVTGSAGTAGVECKVGAGKTAVELKIPRKLAGVAGSKGFYANFTRTLTKGGKKLVTYWRGNKHSADKPIGFAHFKVAE